MARQTRVRRGRATRRRRPDVSYRARYAMPDGTRHSRTFRTKMDAEAWLATERSLIDRDEWTPPGRAQGRPRHAASARPRYNTVRAFAERYLAERGLRPTHGAQLRAAARHADPPVLRRDAAARRVTLSEIKAWRRSLDPKTESSNAAAYRLLRSILQAAEEEELIDRAPPKIRGAGSAPVKQVAVPATFDEIAVIIDEMPDRLKLLIVLAAFVGLREGELLELRRSDVDGVTGRINVTRKVDKDVIPGVRGRLPEVRSRRSARRRRASGVRTVHVPPPFLPMLQKHLLEHTASRPDRSALPRRPHRPHERALPDGPLPPGPRGGRSPDLTIHHLRHTALTLAGQHGATAAELQARAGHASQAAMAIYQHATLDRDKALAEKIGETYDAWRDSQRSE